jgi:hypothetical protein
MMSRQTHAALLVIVVLLLLVMAALASSASYDIALRHGERVTVICEGSLSAHARTNGAAAIVECDYGDVIPTATPPAAWTGARVYLPMVKR